MYAAPCSSWKRANSTIPSMSFASKSLFVEGTESLMLSPMSVKPSIAIDIPTFGPVERRARQYKRKPPLAGSAVRRAGVHRNKPADA